MPDPNGASVSPETGVAKDRGHGFSTVFFPRLNTESLLRGLLCVDLELRNKE